MFGGSSRRNRAQKGANNFFLGVSGNQDWVLAWLGGLDIQSIALESTCGKCERFTNFRYVTAHSHRTGFMVRFKHLRPWEIY